MKTTLLTSVLLGVALGAHASILFEDNFDYTLNVNGSHVNDVNAQWVSGSGGGIGGNTFTGRITNTTTLNPLGRTESAFYPFGGQNSVSDPIAATALGTTYYFSFDLEDNTGGSDAYLQFNGPFGQNFRVGLTGGALGIGVNAVGANNGGAATVALTATTEYFVVGALRVDDDGFGANQDSYSMVASVFTSASAANSWASGVTTSSIVGSEWDISAVDVDIVNIGNADKAFDALTIGGSNVTYWDTIRIGTELGDVTVVPEPSTYALLAGFATLGLVLMRRRLRA